MPHKRCTYLCTCNNTDHDVRQNTIAQEDNLIRLTSSSLRGLVSALQISPENTCQNCRSRSDNNRTSLDRSLPHLESVQHARHKEVFKQIHSLKVHVAHLTEDIQFLISSVHDISRHIKSEQIHKSPSSEMKAQEPILDQVPQPKIAVPEKEDC